MYRGGRERRGRSGEPVHRLAPEYVFKDDAYIPTQTSQVVGSLLARFSEGAVTDAGLLEGVLTTEYLPGVDTPDNPWTQLFQRVWDESGAEGELTNYRIYGMSQAYTFVQALQAAGPDPMREGIVTAVQEQGASFGGRWWRRSGSPVTGTPGCRGWRSPGSPGVVPRA